MNRIIFPLDEMTLQDARKWVSSLQDAIAYFKVGLEMYIHDGPKALRVIGADRCMLDLKLHDIPNTMERACLKATLHGVRFITVHAAAGKEAMKRCMRVSQGSTTDIVAVTILTSLPFDEIRFKTLVNDALDAGVTHFVCSPNEANSIHHFSKNYQVDATIITPGISLTGEQRDDQRRVNTPKAAIANNATYIVVGRPIRSAKDPLAVVKGINRDLA